ncbi:NnrU family protein [Asticcacaulis machinosus]|uniref:NnrU family protein n=1 Tax=Asticcacaulis machinosus TaxID=2984211 RepID=A0ABT5HFK9_9CAUL|nr:NnrU family protein [Asticcacaulis machinosus]MDC7675035.1 NnrU family protein [Asticcacaulis machinosus]
MWTLALACAFFLCIHLMISGTVLKLQIIGAIGPTAYYILFSLFSLAGLIWMMHAYAIAMVDPLNLRVWQAPVLLKALAFVTNFVAFQLVIIGFLNRSPTGMGALKHLSDKPVYGIIRVSRHPILSGIGLWALTHMACNGNLAAWIFFGSLFALCALGANSIDNKRLVLMGDTYRSIKKRTSIVPFVAILTGRTPFVPAEIGMVKFLFASSIYFVVLVFHEFMFGLSAV